jgi:hypothetical protein
LNPRIEVYRTGESRGRMEKPTPSRETRFSFGEKRDYQGVRRRVLRLIMTLKAAVRAWKDETPDMKTRWPTIANP